MASSWRVGAPRTRSAEHETDDDAASDDTGEGDGTDDASHSGDGDGDVEDGGDESD